MGLSELPGSYLICLHLSHTVKAAIGQLGKVTLGEGYYLYVGSARAGIRRRAARYLALARGQAKPGRWHIDALLTHDSASLRAIISLPGRRECEVVHLLTKKGLKHPVARFGATDCRNHCPGHLLSCSKRKLACLWHWTDALPNYLSREWLPSHQGLSAL